ncbi:hypothetical protein GCM10012275_06310 [Longimycelium tulufanense]|uniref:Uncharacterized protein n=1 Tax=Longimycelium tulufanense TaxID=907463 RepID=A0A8J3C988_9PSEU|nr:hypothetical protein [Longimycelium tulufanense]GGM38010.1 hypothetical protein GCM10012275_06310 [Longimycelium tulufanense]
MGARHDRWQERWERHRYRLEQVERYARQWQRRHQRDLARTEARRDRHVRRRSQGERLARQAAEMAPVAGEIGQAVLTGLRGRIAARKDPRARALRKRRRARRALRFRGWTAGIGGGATGAMAILQAPPEVIVGGGGFTALFTALAVSAGLRLRKLNRSPLPEPTAVPPELPPVGSAAREPMERLAGAEQSLNELLRQLRAPGSAGVAAVPTESVSDTEASARAAADALRAVAARLRAVELARDAAPSGEREPLSADVRKLRARLDDGVDDYGRLVAAAGRAVAASADGADQAPRSVLADATDRLAGLAVALRELNGGFLGSDRADTG